MKKALLGLCLLFGSSGVHAYGLDFALSNETANVDLLLNPLSLYERIDGAGLAVGGFVSEDGDSLVHGTLMARGYRQTETTLYNLGVGIKAIAGDIDIPDEAVLPSAEGDSESVSAVAMGLQFGTYLTTKNNPVELRFAGFMAPSITSFSDAERYTEFNVRLQVGVIPSANAYVGYRRMRFDTNDYNNVRLDRSIHLGINLTF